MGLEKIGVQAVVDNIGGYLNDINKMNKATSNAADETEKASKKSEAMTKALQGLGQVVAGLGLTSLFAGMIKSAGDSELALADLDAVLKSTKNAVVGAGDAAGEATGNVKEWQDALEKTNQTITPLLAKLAAHIDLTKEESKTLVDAEQEAQKYTDALDKAAKDTKALNVQGKKAVTVQHLARQAYIDLASSLQKVTRFSDETILSGENMLLTFTQIGKDIFPRATKAVLDYATKFGSVEQAAVAIGKALQDPIAGVTNLRRVGVMLTDSQKDMIEKFVKTGQVAKAQEIILKELETEFGGLAEAAGKTFPGKLDILKNKFDDILEAAGGKLLPKLGELLDVVSKFIDELGPENTANLVLAAAAIGAVVLAIGPLGTALAVILSPIGAIIAAVVAFGVAFQTNFLGIRDLVTTVWNAIKPIVMDIVGFFQNLFAGVDPGAMLTDLKQRLKMALEQMFSSLGIDYRIVDKVFQNLQNVADWFTQTAIPNVLDYISGTVIPGIQDFIDTVVRIWTDVQPYLQDLYDWFVNDALPIVGNFINSFKVNVLEPLITTLSNIWATIQPALSQFYDWFVTYGLPAIKDIAFKLWQNVIVPLIADLQGIWEKVKDPLQSVGKWFSDNGPMISFIVGVVMAGAFSILLGVIREIVNWLSQAIRNIEDFSRKAVEAQKIGAPGGGQWAGGSTGAAILSALFPNGVPLNPTHDFAGPYAANQPYLVGKGAQPELFMPSSAGFAIPNFNIAALASAMPVTSPSFASNTTYNNQSQMGDINFNNVSGADDAIRRYALLRAMGRVK